LQSRAGLFFYQNDIEGIGNTANAGQHKPQHQVDPEILRDLITLVQIDCQGRDEKSENDFYNLVIHDFSPLLE
jgi:hypothetical protein